VARSLGVHLELPPDLVRAALPRAEAVPDGPERTRPGAAFAPRRAQAVASLGDKSAVAADAADLDRLLSLVGRSPDWR
jgi:hypothetical protein